MKAWILIFLSTIVHKIRFICYFNGKHCNVKFEMWKWSYTFPRATISKSIKNICVWKNKYTSSFICVTSRSADIRCDFVFPWNFTKQKSGSHRVYSRACFMLRMRSLIFVARVHAKRIAGNLQNAPSDVSITILHRGGSCGYRVATGHAVNSFRKLIQDNYRDETLKHIN